MTNEKTNLPAIVVGMLIGLLLDIALTALGTGVGLVSIPWERASGESATAGIISSAVGMIIIGIISFGIGGYVAGRMAANNSRWYSAVHGLASFALATLFVVTVGSVIGLSFAGTLVDRAGLAVGATKGADIAMSEISKLRIVTDMSILKGKAVTQFVIPGSSQANTLDKSLKEIGQTADEVTQDPAFKEKAATVAADARKGVALASFSFLALLLIVGAASVWGGDRGGKAARFAARDNREASRKVA